MKLGKDSERPEISRLQDGKYQVSSVLGKGGFGVTYLCVNAENGEPCAVKEYFPVQVADRDRRSGSILPFQGMEEEYRYGKQRFCREAGMLMRLRGLPGIARILDLFEENHTAYYVMEYVEGSTARELMKERGGSLPFALAVDITLQTAEIMDVIHRCAGVFHRDISPENLIMQPDGRVRVIDFGCAREIPMDDAGQHSVVLKPGFAPPEQYSAIARQGRYTDVYALAGTFYYMASGRKLPSAPSRLTGAKHRSLAALVPECPMEVSDVVERALLPDSHRRIQTMAAFAAALREACSSDQENNSPSIRNLPGISQGDSRRDGLCNSQRGSLRDNRKNSRSNQDASDHLPPVWLLVETGALGGKLFPLPKNRWVRIGRTNDRSDVVLKGYPRVSGTHLRICYEEAAGRFLLMDESTNGTWCGNYRFRKHMKYTAAPGCSLYMGSRDCRILLGAV